MNHTLVESCSEGAGPIFLTPYQQIFYNEWLLAPSRHDYNMVLDQSLNGDLDLDRLNRSLIRLVNDHLLLNGNVCPGAGAPFWANRQPLLESSELVRYHAAPLSEAEILHLVRRPFDLEQDLLIRLDVIWLAENSYRLIYVLPHILIDGLSYDELLLLGSKYYNEPGYAHEYSLAEQSNLYRDLSTKLGDVVAHHNGPMHGFWRQHLDGVEEIDLKFLRWDKSFGRVTDFCNLLNPIREHHFNYEGPALIRIRLLTRQYQLTPYVFGQLVYGILLHRMSGQAVIGVNYPVAITEGKALVYGAQVNTLIIDYRFGPATTLADMISDSISYYRDLKMSKAKYLPFDQILAYASHRDLLSCGFTQANLRSETVDYEGICQASVNDDLLIDHVGGLSFEQELGHASLNYKVRFSSDQLDEGLVLNFVGYYQQLFDAILNDLAQNNLDRKISEYDLISASQYTRQVHNWNQTRSAYPATETIHSLFEAQVERTPDHIAVVCQGREISYAELNARSNQLAHYLREHCDIKADDLIALCFDRSEHMLIAIWGVLKSGGAYLPVDPGYPGERICYMLGDAGTKVLLCSDVHAARLATLTDKTAIVSIDTDDSKPLFASYPTTNPVHVSGAADLAYAIYTSGTTGNPKGVMVQHQGVVNLVTDLHQKYGFAHDEVILQFASYVFDASVEQIFLALLNGHRLLVIENNSWEDQPQFLDTLIRNRVSHIDMTPSLLSEMRLSEVKTLRRIICGGERLTSGLLRNLRKNNACVFVNAYGPTEATVTSIVNVNAQNTAIGRPISNTTCYVLGEKQRLLPVGAVGELYIGGAGVARGYLNNEQLTTERFISNPFQTEQEKAKGYNGRLYRTGDLVRYLPDGNLEYLGRNDFQVKIRGYRIELGEIESRLCGYEGISQCVVLAKEHPNGNQYLAGYYVSNDALDDHLIKNYLSAHLPEYMVPPMLVHLSSLPLTINGKLDRRALPDPAFTVTEAYHSPETELQKQLCCIYADVLGLEQSQVGIDDDFFGLGGNSILSIRLVSRIKIALGARIAVNAILTSKTVRGLASHIAGGNNESISMEAIAVSSPKDQLLSYAQQRLWFIENYAGGTSAYNIPMAVRLQAGVCVDTLTKALEMVTNRHQVLRSYIKTSQDGRGYQQVGSASLQVGSVTVSSYAELEEVLKAASNHVFDLSLEYPIKVSFYHLDTAVYLSVVIHHIAFDGWSTDVFLRELLAAYHGEDLPVLPFQYKDYALWQRQYLSGRVLEDQLAYWKAHLSGYETLNLITDKPRPVQVSYEGSDIYFRLDSALSSALRQQARSHQVSLYSVLLSGYYLLLSAYSGQDDIVVGSPVANRHVGGTQDIIGFFVNTLVLRQHIRVDQSISELILSTGDLVRQAQLHQDLPFERLVEELGITPDRSRHAVFQVLFGVENFGRHQDIQAGGLFETFQTEEVYSPAKFDLSLMMDDSGEELHGVFNYAVGLFERGTVQGYADTYEQILRSLASCPGHTKTQALNFLAGPCYQVQVSDWNQTRADYPKDQPIHSLFEAQSERTPDSIAVVYEGTSLTYRELNERSNRLAHYLRDQCQVGADDLIALCLDRSECMLVAILAVLKSGAAYVPIDGNFPDDRIGYMLGDTGARVILASQAYKARLLALTTGKVAVILLDGDETDARFDDCPVFNPGPLSSPGDLAYVIYTSGTTGRPKGVMVQHGSVVNLSATQGVALGLAAGAQRCLWYSNYVFDAHVWELYTCLAHGHTVYIAPDRIRIDINSLKDYIENNGIHVATIPPALLDRSCMLPLKTLVVAGEVTDKAVMTLYKHHGVQIINAYGPTESTVCATLHVFEPDSRNTIIGRPISNTTCYVLDDNQRLLPVGAVGELYIGGAGVARGYLNNEALTNERFLSNPFQTEQEKSGGYNGRLYRTGDLVRYLPDGNLEYLGRNDFQVKIRGYRIELGEIESRLGSIEGIIQCVVLAKELSNGNKYLAGYYVSNDALDDHTIKGYLSAHLPDYMVPQVLVHLSSLPLTVNGKLDRRALPDPAFTVTDTYHSPETALQKQLCGIYADVLGLEQSRVGIDDDFFGLGGNSILSIRLVSRINSALGTSIAVNVIFTSKTVRSLASHIAEGNNESVSIEAIEVSSSDEQLLSYSQQRIWFIENYAGGTSAYNIPMVVRLQDGVDLDLLMDSLEQIVDRHHVLRSLIKISGEGTGYQQVGSDSLQVGSLTVSSYEELEDVLKAASNHVFDLSFEYPIKVNFYHLDTAIYLSVVVHHIAFDGWSTDVFLKELLAAYHGKGLPALPFQYKDYALWQRQYLLGKVLEDQLHYWEKQLSGYQILNLITDKPRPVQLSYEGADLTFSLEAALSAALREKAMELNVSLYSVLLSGFYLLLSRYSGQDDVVVGAPVSNRHIAGTHELIGFFVNTLALRAQIDMSSSAGSFIRKVGETVLQGQLHQDLPFERLVDELHVAPDPARHAVFQVLFSMESFGREQDFSGLFEAYEGTRSYSPAKFDLSVTIDDSKEILSGSFNYAVSLFDERTIQGYIRTYKQILSQLVHSEKLLRELDYVSSTDYKQQMTDWNATRSFYPNQETVHNLFEKQAAKTPDNIAVVYEDTRLTYRELNERSNQLAHYLRKQYDIKPGELIALCLDRSEHMLIAILAVLKAGGAYVPIDPGYPDERTRYILDDTAAKVLLCSDVYAGRLGGLAGETAIVPIDDADFQNVFATYPSINPTPVSGADELCDVIYTSGTTGNPKGVMVTHGSTVNVLESMRKAHCFTEQSKITAFTSYGFDVSVFEFFIALLNGHQLHVLDEPVRTDVELLSNYLIDQEINCVYLPPAILSVLPKRDYRSLKTIIYAGEPCDYQTGCFWSDKLRLYNYYGPTEATIFATGKQIQMGDVHLIGRPISNTACYVLDESQRLLPVGAVGELYIGGAGVARGYLNNEALTNERFLSNPFQTEQQKAEGYNGRLYRTGDMVRYLPDGNLEYLGRNDFQVKIRGYRIELGEIESRLGSYEGINQCVVLAKEHSYGNKYLAGYYVSQNALDDHAIKGYLSAHLPEYMVPQVLVHLSSLPLTVNGKLDRSALPDPAVTATDTYRSPETELQKQLCNIYAEVLGLKQSQVGIDDDFFALGGDSIVSIQMVSRIRQRLGISVRVKDVFTYRNIGALSAFLKGRITSAHAIQAETGLLEGSVALLPIQSWFFHRMQQGDFGHPGHWNQSFLIRVECLDLSLLEISIRKLLSYHDVLRMAYQKNDEGYQQYYQRSLPDLELRYLDRRDLSDLELSQILTDWQTGFDLLSGPLFSVGYIEGYPDGSARIFFAFHHLIIDAVSWRIITADLEKIYNWLAGLSAPDASHAAAEQILGMKRTSYRQWGNALGAYLAGDTAGRASEASYWANVCKDINANNAAFHAISAPQEHHTTLVLSAGATSLLLHRCSHAYNTQINDILLACLGRALAGLTGQTLNNILLEGHGREAFADDIDLTGTVGWFTSMHPVALQACESLSDSIVSVKESLRSTPFHGIGYGAIVGYNSSELPVVIFNYLGQFDTADQDSSGRWSLVDEDSGKHISSSNKGHHVLSLNGGIVDGELHFGIDGHLSEQQLGDFTRSYQRELEEMISYLSSCERSWLTESDTDHIVSGAALARLQSEGEIEGVYLANSLQQGFVYHALSQEPEDDAYHTHLSWYYRNAMDADLLRKAWQLAQHRYASLRLRFDWNDDLLQIIEKQPGLDWRYRDASMVDPMQQEGYVRDLVNADRSERYDLSAGRLCRVYLVKLSQARYYCLFSSHHAILDGWSSPILLRYVHRAYLRLIKREPVPFEVDLSYGLSQSYLQKHRQQNVAYWLAYVEQLSELEDLSGLLRAEHRQLRLWEYRRIRQVAKSRLQIHGDQYRSLKALCVDYGFTMNALIQYLWHKQLSLYSGSSLTVVGMVVSGRDLAVDGIESSVGLHINTLPVMMAHRDEPMTASIIRLQDMINEANSRSDISLASLQKDGNRLFNSLFVYENYPLSIEGDWQELIIEDISSAEKTDYALSLVCHEMDDTVNIELSYAGELFNAEMMDRLLGGMEFLSRQFAASPHAALSQIGYVGGVDYEKQVKDWNATRSPYPDRETIHSLFEKQAAKAPESIAVIYEDTQLTYQELNERSNQLAHYLREYYDIKPDELIALCLDRSEHMLVAILAVLKAGGAYVPIDPGYPDERTHFILRDTAARVLLCNDVHAGRLAGLAGETAIVPVDGANFKDVFASYPTINPAPISGPTNLCDVIYTSGTTGNPKGVMVQHQGVVNLVTDLHQKYGFAGDEVILQVANYVFDACVGQTFLALLNGYRLLVIKNDSWRDQTMFIETLMANGVTHIHGTPSFLEQLNFEKIATLRRINSGGEALPSSLLKRCRRSRIPLINSYGPTEATVSSVVSINTDHAAIGRPISNTTCYVLDENQRLLPVGAVGELYIGGAGVARGYLNNEALTNERFLSNPFQTEQEKAEGYNGRLYRTGDLVRYLPDGNLEYLGRNDFQVKIRGYRIELGEIESWLGSFEGISQCVVLAKEQSNGNQYLAGYYVSQNALDDHAIKVYLSAHLPDYMVPQVLVHLTSLPLTINGKLDRRALPDPAFAVTETYCSPETELQKQLCGIYADVLGLEVSRVGIDDDFFGLGGNSILSIRLVGRINSELGRQVSVNSIFSYRNIRSLASYIEEGSQESVSIEVIEVSSPEDQLLSYAQQRLWFIENYAGGTSAYNIPMVVKLQAGTDIERLLSSLQQIVDRHHVLRSLIKTSGEGTGYQQVGGESLQVGSLTVSSYEELEDILTAASKHVFDLSLEYPIKVSFYHLDTVVYLSVVVHHIAFDGWSTDVFLKELLAAYHGKGLSVLPFQYKDYALWQRQYLQGKVLEDQLQYWKKQLSGYQTLNLITDKPRPRQVSYEGADLTFSLDAALSAALREKARELNVSLYSVLLSGFYLLLSRYSGQDDVVVGTPVSNRHHAGSHELIGFFVNTLALRAHIDMSSPAGSFIRQVGEMVLQGQLHQDLPFERLVDELHVTPDPARHAVFQVLFSVQGFGTNQGEDLSDLFEQYENKLAYSPAKFDLTVIIDDSKEILSGSFNYAVSLFDECTIQGYIHTYQQILSEIVHSEKLLRELDYVSSADYERQITDWNTTRSFYPSQEKVHSLFEKQAAKTPDKIAVVYEDTRLTYQQLNERSNQLAHYIRKQYDIKPDELIALCLDRSEHMLIAILAVLKAGGAYVPIDPGYPEERTRFILADTAAKVLLCNQAHTGCLAGLAGETAIVPVDNADFQNVFATYPTINPTPASGADELCYVMYTSGTTGNPKGVMVQHQSVVNLMANLHQKYEITDTDVLLQFSNYAFDASTFEIWGALLRGAKLVVVKDPLELASNAAVFKSFLLRTNTTVLWLTKTLFDQLYLMDRHLFDGLKNLFVGGEALDKDLIQKLVKQAGGPERVINGYGPTETTTFAATYLCSSCDRDIATVPIGRPIANVTCYVLDGSQNLLPVGAVGELYIGGTGVARGYLNNKTLTDERFLVNPFQTEQEKAEGYNGRLYRTGDLVRYLPDGNLEYLGRNDSQVKIRGYRIELGEIESRLGSYEGINQCVVLAKEQSHGNKYLAGYYVSQHALDDHAIKVYLSAHLPEYMVLQVLVHLTSLPLTPNGKLDRSALPDPAFTVTETYCSPTTELEKQLCGIYAAVLGFDQDQVGLDDDFFRLGGDSIVSIQLVSRIRQSLGVVVHVRDIFSYRTVRSLSQYVSSTCDHSTSLKTESGILTGPVGFLPIQSWFFDHLNRGDFPAYNHWNQSFLIRVPALDQKILKQSIRHLLAYHDALRLCYQKTSSGYEQYYSQDIEEVNLQYQHVGSLSDLDLEAVFTDWQKGFDIFSGRLFSVGYVDGYADDSARIFF